MVAVGSAFCGLYAPVCAAAGSYDIARAYGTSSNEALRGAAIAGASAFVFTQIGSRFTSTQSGFWQVDGVGHIGAHALAGGVISVLQGGKFGHGFISAGLTKGLDVAGLTDFGGEGGGWVAARTAVAATAGGTISAATGGKFANGARTAAFGHLYNQERARARSNAQKGTVKFNYKTEGLERFQDAADTYGVTALFEDLLPAGEHVIDVSIDITLGPSTWMRNPDARTINVNPDFLNNQPLNFIASAIGHELIHVNDHLRGRINRHDSASVRASERRAYIWQGRNTHRFEMDIYDKSLFLRKAESY